MGSFRKNEGQKDGSGEKRRLSLRVLGKNLAALDGVLQKTRLPLHATSSALYARPIGAEAAPDRPTLDYG